MTPHPAVLAPEHVRPALAALLEQALEGVEVAAAPHAWRIEIPVQSIDPIEWLAAQKASVNIYWADRAGRFRVAGINTADRLVCQDATAVPNVFAQMATRLGSGHPNLRYYGGLRFPGSDKRAPAWEPFGYATFVLPQFELLVHGDQSYLACNLLLDGDKPIDSVLNATLRALDALVFPDAPAFRPHPRIALRQDTPNFDAWRETVTEALDAIHNDDLAKIVLARKTELRLDGPVDAFGLLAALSAPHTRTYRFLFQPAPGVAFLGASPERLYARRTRHIEAEAVAGTRPRGATPDRDVQLSEALLANDKERREHAFVAEAVRAALAGLCSAVHADDQPTLLKLPHCQHLYRRFEGLLDGRDDGAIVHALHPTPAVGGWPKERACERIAALESFDRGWYAAPIGYVGGDNAEFAVAIRSGLVNGDTATLYAGAGIVEGSDPAAEWDELENKLGTFLGVFGEDAN